jgi:hypothetical protein
MKPKKYFWGLQDSKRQNLYGSEEISIFSGINYRTTRQGKTKGEKNRDKNTRNQLPRKKFKKKHKPRIVLSTVLP